MTREDLTAALQAADAPREAHRLLRWLMLSGLSADERGMPFRPHKIARARRALRVVLAAIDAAEKANPRHFQIVKGSK